LIFGKKNITTQTDAYLVYQFQKTRDGKYFGELYSRYSHLVFGLCMKYFRDTELSNDATQQIFEKLFLDLKTTQVSYFKSWLYIVSKNYCLMQLRKKMPEKTDASEISNKEEEEPPLTEEHYHGIEEALNQLNEDQKNCIELFYLKDMSYKDIADNTGYDLNQVKSFIQNGKRNLKNLLLKNETFKHHT
jgi:RNA polymerase sigma factor (sigma-70 family)